METNEYREQRLASMRALKEMGYEPYGRKYDHVDLRVLRENFEEGAPVRVAGRLLMGQRLMGQHQEKCLGVYHKVLIRTPLSETIFSCFD